MTRTIEQAQRRQAMRKAKREARRPGRRKYLVPSRRVTWIWDHYTPRFTSGRWACVFGNWHLKLNPKKARATR